MRLGDIAKECRTTFNGDKNNVPIVGLEHLQTGELCFSEYDINTDNTFSKAFTKGQILFGRRRAYLKKAAIADFDGICSGDITVIEAIPNRVLPELLPFVIQNDRFFNYAVKHSAGGLSPRVKWNDLLDYEVNIPTSLVEQKLLADKLWAAYRLKESYKKLLTATDDMVKSQFIEMFGNPFINDKGWDIYSKIENYAEIVLGSTPDTKNTDYWDGDCPWITPAELADDTFMVNSTERNISYKGVKSAHLVKMPKGTVLFSTRAPIGKIGITTVEMYCNQGFKNFVCKKGLNNVFLYYTLKYNKKILQKWGTGTTFKELSKKVVTTLRIAIPPIELQNKFAAIAQQADKSKLLSK